jgi:hypothetical protein
MNILKSILNALTPSTEPLPPMATAPTPAAAPKTAVPIGAVDPAKLDKWEKKYSSPPYFKSAFSRKNLGWTCDPLPHVTNKIFTMVFEKAQPLFSAGDLQTLTKLKAQWDKIESKFAEVNFMAASSIYKARAREAGERFLAGELPQASGRQETQNNVVAIREHLHAEKRKISELVYSIVQPACERLKAAARELTEIWDGNERSTHELFADENSATPFKPSDALRAFIWIALDGADSPIRNFKLCGFMVPPDMKNLASLWWSPKVISKPIENQQLREVEAAAESRRALERQAQETDMAERKKQVEEHNAWIEKTKQQAAQNIADAQNREALAAAEKELRKQNAIDALKNPKPPEPEKKP